MNMQIIIFGATGSLGSHVAKQALEKGYLVTAFTRNPEKLQGLNSPNLTTIRGNVHNSADVEKALKDKQAVLCALGDGSQGKVRGPGTLNILEAMTKLGVRRLICQSTLGIGDSWNNLNFFWKHAMFGFLLKKAFIDHQLQEKYIFNSKLDYTIVRSSAFTNGDLTQHYKVGFNDKFKGLSLNIARADVADFMLRQLISSEYAGKSVSISN
jgi:uncharacterized protein YbjT (DUF2867 family)